MCSSAVFSLTEFYTLFILFNLMLNVVWFDCKVFLCAFQRNQSKLFFKNKKIIFTLILNKSDKYSIIVCGYIYICMNIYKLFSMLCLYSI